MKNTQKFILIIITTLSIIIVQNNLGIQASGAEINKLKPPLNSKVDINKIGHIEGAACGECVATTCGLGNLTAIQACFGISATDEFGDPTGEIICTESAKSNVREYDQCEGASGFCDELSVQVPCTMTEPLCDDNCNFIGWLLPQTVLFTQCDDGLAIP